VILLLALACRVPRPMVATEEARIQRVEDGLLPPVVIEGRPATGRPIEERMARYRVPGVGIAVIEVGRVIWARGYGEAASPGARFPLDPPLADQLGTYEATPEQVARHVAARGESVRVTGRAGVVFNRVVGQGAVVMTTGEGGAPLVEEILRAIAAEYGWPDHPPPITKSVFRVAPSTYDAYVGRYVVGASALVVERSGDRLTVTTPGGEAAELFPEARDRFFLLDSDTTIAFQRDRSGKVVALVAQIAGREIRAPREP
jgi:hypothetical protein